MCERKSKEIKRSKGVSEVSERAMNHGDIPGWVSVAAAVWSPDEEAEPFKH